VALALISVAVIWMLRSFSQTVLTAERARDQRQALAVLNEQMVLATVTNGVPLGTQQGTASEERFTWHVSTVPFADETSALLKAEITVQWEQREQPRAVRATTWMPYRDE